jgi:uncharacterized protein YjiS (DUF1127 family)
MPAITALVLHAGAPLVRALTALGVRLDRGLKQLARRMQNRRDALRLAELDGRMLADIGLTRSDLRDAYAEPLWRDPTDVLVQRATERRSGRRRTAVRGPASQPAAPKPASLKPAALKPASPALFRTPPDECYPRLDRSGRYLV